MRIREQREIVGYTPEEERQQTFDAIAELEQQHRDGVMETPAYLMKKKALVRLL